MTIKKLFVQQNDKKIIECDSIKLIENIGIENDIHINSKKQIAISNCEAFDILGNSNGLCHKKFRPNIVLDGYSNTVYSVGDKIEIGSAVIEITAVKPCFPLDCALAKNNMPCPLRNGVAFAKVVKSGVVSKDE